MNHLKNIAVIINMYTETYNRLSDEYHNCSNDDVPYYIDALYHVDDLLDTLKHCHKLLMIESDKNVS